MMFKADDYFDKAKQGKPYKDLDEYLQEHAFLIDFLLEKTVEIRADENRYVYTPGAMMTDERAQTYYDTHPSERIKSPYDQDAAEELGLIIEHIRSRENATKKIKLPLEVLRKELKLTFFEELSLLLPLALARNINIRNIYAYIANDAALKVPTTGVLYSIYQIVDQDAELGLLHALTDKMGKMNVFFLDAQDTQNNRKSLMEMPLTLREDVLSFLNSGEGFNSLPPYTGIYSQEKTNLNIFKDIADWDITCNGFLYVADDDPDDVLQFLTEKCDKGILILDGDHLISDVKKSRIMHGDMLIAHALGELFFRIRITDEPLCIKLLNPESGYCGMFLGVIGRFLPGRTIYIYGDNIFPKILMSAYGNISSLKLPAFDFEERKEIWNYFLEREGMDLGEDINISDLADCYEISLSKIRYAVSQASLKARWKGEKIIDSGELKEQLRFMGDAGLKSLAVYIPPVYSIEDLQIEESQKMILMTACSRFKIKNRVEKKYGIRRSGAYGNGVSLLLSGPPGTGKTMAAQVISKELSLPLYRVDLSQIISKYIGETQKNINEIFEQAAKSNVILFFDEADALFSKRTEVKDSNDKYANAETAYLLQKVEGYNGMTILATNLYSNFDTAFVRRLTYFIRLQKPDEETRLILWKTTLPKGVELAKNIDFEYFAQDYDISGSEIKAVLYSAMYMAAAKNKPLGNEDIACAIKLRPENAGSLKYSVAFEKY